VFKLKNILQFLSDTRMCHYYGHLYSCKHVTYALAKYCSAAGLVQTPCKKRSIWQNIRMGEECDECAVPAGRGNNVTDGGDFMQGEKDKENEKVLKGGKSKSVGVKRKVRRAGR
jgi:hypothetical protein